MDELVKAVIDAGMNDIDSWWFTRHGTILVFKPEIVMYIGMGRLRFKFGVAEASVFGPEDISEIPITFSDANALWCAKNTIEQRQIAERRRKALASIGR